MVRFDGADVVPERDSGRLSGQLQKIASLMSDGCWRTLSEIGKAVDAPEASVSAQLRNLRKPRFGGYKVKRMYVESGLYIYQLLDGDGIETAEQLIDKVNKRIEGDNV